MLDVHAARAESAAAERHEAERLGARRVTLQRVVCAQCSHEGYIYVRPGVAPRLPSTWCGCGPEHAQLWGYRWSLPVRDLCG